MSRDLKTILKEKEDRKRRQELYPVSILQNKYATRGDSDAWIAVSCSTKYIENSFKDIPIDEGGEQVFDRESLDRRDCVSIYANGSAFSATKFWEDVPDWVMIGRTPDEAFIDLCGSDSYFTDSYHSHIKRVEEINEDANHVLTYIFEDRYGGGYSKGNWLAVSNALNKEPVDSFRLEVKPTLFLDDYKRITRFEYVENWANGDDTQANDISGFWFNPPAWVASGWSPNEAVANLGVTS